MCTPMANRNTSPKTVAKIVGQTTQQSKIIIEEFITQLMLCPGEYYGQFQSSIGFRQSKRRIIKSIHQTYRLKIAKNAPIHKKCTAVHQLGNSTVMFSPEYNFDREAKRLDER